MSKTYRIKLGAVTAQETAHRNLQCPDLVPNMGELLGDALRARGWTVDAEGRTATKTLGQGASRVAATVDLGAKTLDLKSESSADLVGRAYDVEDNDERGKRAARENAEEQRSATEARAREKAARALLSVEKTVADEVNLAVRETLRAAILVKARQLGEVQNVSDTQDADGRPVTRVTVSV